MKSRGRQQIFREGTHTHTLGAGGKVWSAYIYILSTCVSHIHITHTYMSIHTIHYPHMHIYISYTDILLYTQGGKHAASACKGGIYPHKEGSTRKREQMIRGDKHKRKIALVHRGRTRAYGTKRGGGISKGCRRY
jgi:hypothetical protein